VTSRPRALVVSTVLAVACGHAAPPRQSLGGGDVASVGALPIPVSLVAEVARRSGISARAAADRLVADALAATGARAAGMDRTGDFSWPITAALARRVPARLMDQALSQGPPSDGELATLTVVHAIVLRSPGVPEERALGIAGAIRQAVASARSGDEFEALANAVPHPGTQVVVQRIHGVGADGKAPEGAEFDPVFVAAAFALRSPGDTSWIVETPFGWHTIYLVDRTLADPASIERLRSDLAPAVARMRVRIRTQAILHARKQRSSIDVSEAAEALMAEVTTAP